ncbi:S53 family peptidase [Limobrevibacterium gyesilva]|uniref:S53 family peptidase n=1 Tax=Limobrevibacterium gyesilva TaxID=2991712 RepID=A0AA41YS11_9PROT|nr:S53 family peptidase [Limobrevibacterium gyesilva]MCW3477487.1 S53 family peptidase [Limobrevibacterium gyesilva]
MVSKTQIEFAASHKTLPDGVRRVADVAPDENIEVSVYLKAHPHTAETDEALPATDRRGALHARRAEQYKDDIRLLSEFAAENGLTVTAVEPGRRLVKLTGSASKMQTAFGTNLAVYDDGKQQFRGRSGALRLPQDVESVVEAVLGLDTRQAAEPHFVVGGAILPEVIIGHRPNTVGIAYGFPTGLTGSGQCIGIIELGGGYLAADTAAAFAAMGLPAPTVVSVSVDGGQNAPGSPDDGEVALDIQVAGGVAPGARIAVYFAPNTFQGFVDAVSAAANDAVNKAHIISISWGAAELHWTQQAWQAMNNALQDAATLGISVFAASGDHLGTDGVANGKANVDYPASSPWAIGCGGTTIDTTGNTINSEVVWNKGASGWGTGGGISDLFAVPAFQQGVNLPASVNDGQHRRGVPDVAADADRDSGYLIVLNGQTLPIGGTSGVAPLWAGLTALINQAAPAPVGFFLPKLYQNPQALRNITQGNNRPVNSNLGYTAGAGWDACTGLGVPIGGALLQTFTAHLVAGPVGVLTVNQRPYAFVQTPNGHLWVNWWDGSAWHWSDQGTPIGGLVAGPVGVLTMNQRPYAFVRSNTGQLWVNWWDGTAWHWSGQGTPTGGTVVDTVGVTTVNQRPYAFVRSNTGHLWVNWWDGAAWHWSDQGTPTGGTVAGTVGVTTMNQRPYAFVRSNSGHLWVNWWDGAAWHWSDQGTPGGGAVVGPVGVCTLDQRPYAFVQSNTGHLWVNWWDGAAWHWSDQGTPGGGTVAGQVGVLTVLASPHPFGTTDERPYAFVRASSGHMWVNWWDGAAWHWSDQGTPTAGSVAGPVGVTTVNQRPYAFVRSQDNHLWVNWWDGAQWHWSAQ